MKLPFPTRAQDPQFADMLADRLDVFIRKARLEPILREQEQDDLQGEHKQDNKNQQARDINIRDANIEDEERPLFPKMKKHKRKTSQADIHPRDLCNFIASLGGRGLLESPVVRRALQEGYLDATEAEKRRWNSHDYGSMLYGLAKLPELQQQQLLDVASDFAQEIEERLDFVFPDREIVERRAASPFRLQRMLWSAKDTSYPKHAQMSKGPETTRRTTACNEHEVNCSVYIRNLCNFLHFFSEWRVREPRLLSRIFKKLMGYRPQDTDWLGTQQMLRHAAVLGVTDVPGIEEMVFAASKQRLLTHKTIEVRQATTMVWSLCVLAACRSEKSRTSTLVTEIENSTQPDTTNCSSSSSTMLDSQEQDGTTTTSKATRDWLSCPEFRGFVKQVLFVDPQHFFGNHMITITDLRMALRVAIALDLHAEAEMCRKRLWTGHMNMPAGFGGEMNTPQSSGRGLDSLSASERLISEELTTAGLRHRNDVWFPLLDRSVDFILDVRENADRGTTANKNGTTTKSSNEISQDSVVILEYDGPVHFYRSKNTWMEPTGRDRFETWLIHKLGYSFVRMPYWDVDPFRAGTDTTRRRFYHMLADVVRAKRKVLYEKSRLDRIARDDP
ncbi:unnamed protein product [Amoebophrya sp. A25]|nr:unnamed protein product [Amoebophrya sp. A25]|eukprot:GSA25T00023538001.1